MVQKKLVQDWRRKLESRQGYKPCPPAFITYKAGLNY